MLLNDTWTWKYEEKNILLQKHKMKQNMNAIMKMFNRSSIVIDFTLPIIWASLSWICYEWNGGWGKGSFAHENEK
jgi:hypothetical protein